MTTTTHMTRARILTLSAVLLAALPASAAAGQRSDSRVKIDAKVQIDQMGAQVHINIPHDVSRDIGEMVRDITRGITDMVTDVTRDISRDISVDVNREISRSMGRDMSRDIGREIGREIGRLGNFDDQERGTFHASADDRQTRTIAIGPNGTLEMENLAGDVTVTAGSGKDVSIEFVRSSRGKTDADAKAGLDRARPEVDVVGTRATVRATYMDRPTSYGVSTDFVVKAPAGTRIVVNSLRADVHVTGIKGELKITTASGSIVLTDVGTVVEAKTGNGDVTIKGAVSDGELDAGTLNGDITLTDIKARRLTANTVNGGIVARNASCDAASLSTMTGDVLYAGSLARGGRYELTSNSGEVRFSPAGSTGYTLQATSFTGEISSSIPLTNGETSRALTNQRPARRRATTAKVGDGSATVTLQTFSGGISIGAKK
jgi:DUF4097 and DUF4098 domain-containing protein YvlB